MYRRELILPLITSVARYEPWIPSADLASEKRAPRGGKYQSERGPKITRAQRRKRNRIQRKSRRINRG